MKSNRRKDHPLYETWRCLRKRHVGLVSIFWDDFETFVHDVGPKPSLDHILVRQDETSTWKSGNTLWMTRPEYARHRLGALTVDFLGQPRLFMDLCETFEIDYNIAYTRHFVFGQPLLRALYEPIRGRGRPQRAHPDILTILADYR